MSTYISKIHTWINKTQHSAKWFLQLLHRTLKGLFTASTCKNFSQRRALHSAWIHFMPKKKKHVQRFLLSDYRRIDCPLFFDLLTQFLIKGVALQIPRPTLFFSSDQWQSWGDAADKSKAASEMRANTHMTFRFAITTTLFHLNRFNCSHI